MPARTHPECGVATHWAGAEVFDGGLPEDFETSFNTKSRGQGASTTCTRADVDAIGAA